MNWLARFSGSLFLFAASCGLAFSAERDPFPAKALTLIVPYGPGAASDVVSRLLADSLSRTSGQPVVPINKPGANGIVALNAVQAAAADGYTMQFSASSIVNEQVLKKGARFDVGRDVIPVGRIASAPLGVFVSSHLPVNSVKELIEYARKNPGKVTYASPGVGSVIHLAVERLRLATGIDLLHVPYPAGTAPVLTALITGDVLLYVNEMGSMQGVVSDGKVKVLGTLASARSPLFPDAPATPEMAVPELKSFAAPFFFGLYVKAGTPIERVDYLNRMLEKSMHDPRLQDRLKGLGYLPESFGGTTPASFKTMVMDELARAERVVHEANITVPQ